MPTGISPDKYILDEAGKDLKPTAKKTLADYLSARTRGGAETFTPPAQGGGEYTYLPPRPNAYPVLPTELTEIPADASRVSPGSYATDSDMQRLVGDPNMRNVVKMEPAAERAQDGGVNGNEVLNSSLAKSRVVSSVLSKNRFSSGDNKFTAKSYNDAMPKSPVIMTQAGEAVSSSDNVYETMRRAAISSMLNAAGGSSGPGADGTFNLNDIQGAGPASSDVINALNSSQLGIAKIEAVNTRTAADRQRIPAPSGDLTFEETDTTSASAADLETAFENGDIPNAEGARYTKMSFGQLNTYLEQFSGAGTTNMVLLAVTAYAALFVAVSVVAFIMSAIIGKLPRPNYSLSTLPLGAERGPSFGAFLFDNESESSATDFLSNLGNLLSKVLGVMQPYEGAPVFSYFFAALEGALSIIGINVDEIGSNPITILADALPKVLINFGLTPGYYLTLIREIARDLSLLVDGGSAGSGILGIIDSLRTLKIVRFVDTCARIGIINAQSKRMSTVMNPDTPAGDGWSSAPQGGDSSSPTGLLTDVYKTAQRRVSRSRETEGNKRLAWSHSSLGYSRSELVTKDLMRSLSLNKIGDKETGIASLRSLKARKLTGESGTGRISAAQREYHEQILDAEYMPFYFHDLRTNEILSFHAFLSSLSDSFTSNYTAVDGFGRMDPVQIYKNTTRAISFTFTVAATSPDDHEQMWYSVNKLVNMIYPQWSEGDEIIGADGSKYTQPFSQTIAASPMLRVRIGDVIHSNYSRFALSRIFGLDKQGAKIGKTALDSPDKTSVDGDFESMYDATTAAQGNGVTDNKVVSAAVSSAFSPTAEHDLNSTPQINIGNDVISTVLGTIRAVLKTTNVEITGGRYKIFESYEDATSKSNGNLERLEDKESGTAVAYVVTEKSTERDPQSYVIVKLDTPKKLDPLFGSEKTYTHALVPSTQARVVGGVEPNASDVAISNTSPDKTRQAVVDKFMNPNGPSGAGNPIVRSFESGAGGRGLAGFITQLGLEYGNTENTWNVERGSRAPNMVSISVSFTPIHDIPMGLAADGTARSAAYAVGDTTRKRFMPDLAQKDYEARRGGK